MPYHRPHCLVVLAIAVASAVGIFAATPAGAQELGHKLLGGAGINAGVQPEPGFYVMNRLVFYGADQLRDRNGDVIPVVGLDVDVVANVLGISFTKKLARGPYVSASIGAPLARISIDADHPLLAIDASGFGDVFVQPIRVGGRFARFDASGAYTFYAPTGHFEPGGSVGRGYWTHEFSLGAALRPQPEWRISVLASYDINRKKRGIDITRGNTFQLQGGAGATLRRVVQLGVAGFALWQVTDNTGSDLPPVARDARTRAFGLGPELGVTIPSIRTRIDSRYEWEFGVRSRQDGGIFVLSATVMAWSPGPLPVAPIPGR